MGPMALKPELCALVIIQNYVCQLFVAVLVTLCVIAVKSGLGLLVRVIDCHYVASG